MATQFADEAQNVLVGNPSGPIMGQGIDSSKLGDAGSPPYRRGIHEGMYTDRLWTMRQYAGFSSPSKTNERFKQLLKNGQTGLSVAFDLPTQLGFDSDDEQSLGEVGRVGVAIDSIHDMRALFDEIDLSQVSTSMTINAPATTLLALYVAVADEQGVPREKISGTVQNDIIKEYIARGLYIYPPHQSIRLTTDLMSWCSLNIPQWNTISVSGYHLREAGCTAAQEIGLTISNALFYSRNAIATGLQFDDFAPRMSFFFACHNDFIEEIAKFRAARVLWNTIVEEEFTPSNPKSSQLRFHTQTSGVTLTAQQPFNNAIRVAYQALSAVLGGTQSLHTNSYDEALGLPTEQSVSIALRTQQILAEETGVTNHVDPLGGSEAVEELTEKIIADSKAIIEEIDEMGGAMDCLKAGHQQRMIHESAWEHLIRVESGIECVVGVNSHTDGEVIDYDGLQIDSNDETEKIAELSQMKENRDTTRVSESLEELVTVCRGEGNIMDAIINAVKSEATVGEINGIMRHEFGTWMAPSGV
jgi:methylmalonyl-CoA mutase N-terminal domain/subunit